MAGSIPIPVLLGDNLKYWLKAEFNVAEAAPIASPYTPLVGDDLTVVDVESVMPISGGALAVDTQITKTWGDQGFYGGAKARAAGATLMWKINGTNASGDSGQGFQNLAAVGNWSQGDHAIRGVGTGLVVGNLSWAAYPSMVSEDVYFAICLRSSGAYYFVKSASTIKRWTLICVDDSQNSDPLWPWITNYSGIHDLYWMRGVDLPYPFNDDYGLAHERYAGARSPGDTFTHPADCLIEFTVTTVPAAGQIEKKFRINDNTPASENLLRVTVDSTGAIDLDRLDAGVVTQLDTSAAAVANGNRIQVIADDDDLKVVVERTLELTATEASYKTEESGELETEGTGGAVSDIVIYNRIPPQGLLNAMAR